MRSLIILLMGLPAIFTITGGAASSVRPTSAW